MKKNNFCIILSVAIFLFNSHSFSAEQINEYELSKITKIEINNTSGDTKIRGIESGRAKVTVKKRKFEDPCKLTVELKKTILHVKIDKLDINPDHCKADFDIVAPKTAVLVVNAGSGEVKMKGISSDLTFSIGSGDIDVEGEIKKLSGKAGSGDISLEGHMGGGTLYTGSGEIELKYKNAPTKGVLDIKTGSGNTEIVLPKHAVIQTSFAGGSGSLSNELGDHPDSKFKISVKTGSGNLRIKGD